MEYRERLIRFLEETKEQVRSAVDQLEPSWQIDQPPTALGDWSAGRILAHMRDVECSYGEWSRQMAAGERPAIPPVVWSEEPYDPQESVAQILADFVAARERYLTLLRSLDDRGWNGTATRPLWGQVTVEWLTTKAYQHTLDHLNHLVRLGNFWEIRAREDAQKANGV